VKHDPEPDHIKDVERRTWELLKETGIKGRRTGLGFTALADMFAALNIHFDSEEAFSMAEEIMRIKCVAEFDSSVDLAIERGKFKDFDPVIEERSEFIQMIKEEFPELFKRMMKHGRRNISISTVAPTGSLSILAGTSSGIEPVFMLHYKRRRKIDASMKGSAVDFVDNSGDAWQEHTIYHHGLTGWQTVNPNKAIVESPYAGSTASEISWEKRIRLQSIVQKYVTHSISSTINLPEDVSIDTVAGIYLKAWEHGLKGITVYREGSRTGVLVSDSLPRDTASSFKETIAPKRPKVLDAHIVRFNNGKEPWIAFVGILEGRPYEIFTGKAEAGFQLPQSVEAGKIIKERSADGSKRYDFIYQENNKTITLEGLSRTFNKEYWNYAKLISGILRHGMPLPQVLDLISNLDLMSESINTWKNGVERALKLFIPAGTALVSRKCPECGDPEGLIYEEGCVKCKSCLMSRCG
jgi:ribonucleoside-diphosphate reductase alpha chain